MMIEIIRSQRKIKLHQKNKSQTADRFQSVLWFQKVTVSKLLVFPVILSLWYKLPPREYRSLLGHVQHEVLFYERFQILYGLFMNKLDGILWNWKLFFNPDILK